MADAIENAVGHLRSSHYLPNGSFKQILQHEERW